VVTLRAARLSLVVLSVLGLWWGSASAQDYKYPYRDPYLASITTAILNAEGHVPGLKRQVVHVPVLPGRNALPTLEGRGGLSVALYKQSRPAPLLFIVAGIGSNPYFGAATYFAGLLHRKGYHVAILPSPMSWNFALAASRSGAPGYVPEDARDLYVAMQKTLEVLKTRSSLRITRIVFMGVSLGALEGAYLSVLDAKEGKLGIERYLLANPPTDLTFAVRKLDEMDALREKFGLAKSEAIMRKAMAVAEPFTEERRENPDFGKLVKGFAVFTNDELQFLIAGYLELVLPELIYVSEVIQDRNTGKVTPPEARKRIQDAKSFTFTQYSEKIGVPVWRVQTGDSQADLDAFTKQGSLAPILDELRGNPRVYIIHSADDFLAESKSLDELKEAMGSRMVVYPYGGHLGNLWYPPVRDYVLGVFGSAP
jgi:pimeloyl-ACP methyl ester carboxylesterase